MAFLWSVQQVNPIWAVYFLCFIILTNLTLVNLVTGLIITGVVEHAREDNWTWQQRLVEEQPFIKAIEDFVEQKLPDLWKEGSEGSTSLTEEGFEVLLSVAWPNRYMKKKVLKRTSSRHFFKVSSEGFLIGCSLSPAR